MAQSSNIQMSVINTSKFSMDLGKSSRMTALKEELMESTKFIDGKALEQQIKESNYAWITQSISIQELIDKALELFDEYEKRENSVLFCNSLPVILGPLLNSVFQRVFMKYTHPNIREVKNQMCYCGEPLLMSKQLTKCNYCQHLCHKDCVFSPSLDCNFQCPSCFIKTLDPFSQVSQTKILKIIKLRDKYLEYEIDLSMVGSDEVVEFRCIKIDGDPLYNSQISWPDHCEVFVNKIQYVRMRPLPYNSSLKKRQDGTLTLPESQYLRSTKIEFRNKIQNDRREYRLKSCLHLFGVFVVKKQNVSALVSNILKAMPNQIVYRCALKDRYKTNNKFIQLEKQRIILDCPYSKTRMKIPARGSSCMHLQCFDLNNFLISNKLSRTFKCPIFRCMQRCHILIVDPVLHNIMKSDKLNEVQAVEFSIEGVKSIINKIEPIIIQSDEQEQLSNVKVINIIKPDIHSVSSSTEYPHVENAIQLTEKKESFDLVENAKICNQLVMIPVEKHLNKEDLKSLEEISEKSSQSSSPQIQIQPEELLSTPTKQLYEHRIEPLADQKKSQKIIQISDSDENEEQRMQRLIRRNKEKLAEQKQRVDSLGPSEKEFMNSIVKDIYARLCSK